MNIQQYFNLIFNHFENRKEKRYHIISIITFFILGSYLGYSQESFTINGTLVRVLEKDNPNTFLEWNLQNENFIPIGGGLYIIHVQSQDLGERVLKFFAATRPADLRNF